MMLSSSVATRDELWLAKWHCSLGDLHSAFKLLSAWRVWMSSQSFSATCLDRCWILEVELVGLLTRWDFGSNWLRILIWACMRPLNCEPLAVVLIGR